MDDFEALEAVQADLSLKMRLWVDKSEWTKLRQKILDTPMPELDTAMLERELSKCNKTVFLAGKGLPGNKVVPKLKASVEEFNPVLPLVLDLRNPCIKERHWEQIFNLTGVDFPNSPEFTLSDLIKKGVTVHQEQISFISSSAQQESILEEMMQKVAGTCYPYLTINYPLTNYPQITPNLTDPDLPRNYSFTTAGMWEKLEFEVKPYKEIKDLYVLGDVSEVVASLDDRLVRRVVASYTHSLRPTNMTLNSHTTPLSYFQHTLACIFTHTHTHTHTRYII